VEQCQSLKFLSLNGLEMDHCRVLGAYSIPGLKTVLNRCKLTSAGTSALAEVLGRNQGPARLDSCGVGNFVLANWSHGSSRLNSLTQHSLSAQISVTKNALQLRAPSEKTKGSLSCIFLAIRRTTKCGAPFVVISRHIRSSRS
jgi:hypothetical protein